MRAIEGAPPQIRRGLVGVQVPRAAGLVPVFVDLLASAPPTGDSNFSKVTEAELEVSSGAIAIVGEDNEHSLPIVEIPIESGTYVVRVLYADLDTCTYDDNDGADHYVVQVFPGSKREPETLRAWKNASQPIREYKGSASAHELYGKLEAEDLSVRCGALVALSRLGLLTPVQAAALNDESIGVRLVALGALNLVQARDHLQAIADGADMALIKSEARRLLARSS